MRNGYIFQDGVENLLFLQSYQLSPRIKFQLCMIKQNFVNCELLIARGGKL